MKTISARELRNEYARVLREVEQAGEAFTVTSGGRPVARITPLAPVPAKLLPYSGVPLGDAVGLNAAAGPFDHEAARREREAFLDDEVRDPFAAAAPATGPDGGRPLRDVLVERDQG